MSTLKSPISRRNFLKGAACTSALSIGGLSSVAIAASDNIKVAELNTPATSSVTLFNQSDKLITLHAANPVCLVKVNDWVMLNINKTAPESSENNTTEEVFVIAAGQKMTFSVTSKLAPVLTAQNSNIVITEQYSAFNNFVPLTPMSTMGNGMMA